MGVFLQLVEIAAYGDPEDGERVLSDHLRKGGAIGPHVAGLWCRYLAAAGPLIVATFMDAADAAPPPVDGVWVRTLSQPREATPAELAAVRAVAAYRAGDDGTAQAEQCALIDAGGHAALLEMVRALISICAEVQPPRSTLS